MEDFQADLRRTPSAKLMHAIHIRSGLLDEESVEEWATPLRHRVGSFNRIWWFNTFPRLEAKRGVQHCFFGDFDNITLDLVMEASQLLTNDSALGQFRTDSLALLLYLVAWEHPSEVSYCIDQYSLPMSRAPRGGPFANLEDFEWWERGEVDLPRGRYFCVLSRDLRRCAISAISTLFSRSTPALMPDDGGEAGMESVGNGVEHTPPPERVATRIKWQRWALGLDEGGWWLFRKSNSHWRQVGKVDVPRGQPWTIVQELLQQGGSLTKSDALRLFKSSLRGKSDSDLNKSVIKPALAKLRQSIQTAVKRAATRSVDVKVNPIPFDKHSKAWRCEFQIGTAEPGDEGRKTFVLKE